jgi:hypothetical protein
VKRLAPSCGGSVRFIPEKYQQKDNEFFLLSDILRRNLLRHPPKRNKFLLWQYWNIQKENRFGGDTFSPPYRKS